MNFSIVATIRRLLAPQHELSVSWLTWYRLIAGLRRSGRGFRRESGAFLLGRRSGDRARIVTFVLYDDLDPNCLDTGIVRLDGRHFGALWDECRRRDLVVVADVHTHRRWRCCFHQTWGRARCSASQTLRRDAPQR